MWTTGGKAPKPHSNGGGIARQGQRGLFGLVWVCWRTPSLTPSQPPVHTKPLSSPVWNGVLNTLSPEPPPSLLPLLAHATLLRDTPSSKCTPRPLSQEDRAKTKHPKCLLRPVIPSLSDSVSSPRKREQPCLTRNHLIWSVRQPH